MGDVPDPATTDGRSATPAWRRSRAGRAALLVATVACFALGAAVVRTRLRNDARYSDAAGVAAFLSGHHLECEAGGGGVHALESVSVEAARARVARLGELPELDLLLGSGLVFEGLAPCSVPAGGESLHLVLSLREGDLPGVEASLFVQRGPSQMPLDEDSAYRVTPRRSGVTPEGAAREVAEVLAWRRGELVVFAVSSQLQFARALHGLLGGPPECTATCLGFNGR